MAGTRAHFRDHLTVSNTEGVLRVASGATVYVYNEYTTTPISATIYAHDSNHPTLSATTLSNPLTAGNDGEIEFYLADTDRVTLLIQKTGYSDQTIEIDAIKNPAQALVIQEEGSDLSVRGKLNFIGSTVTAADDAANGRTNVTITAPTSGITVSEGGTPLDTDISTLDFDGSHFDVTESPENEANVVIANDAISYAKMQNVSAASRLLGRGSASGSGDPQELTVGTGLSISGTELSSTVTSGLTKIAETVLGSTAATIDFTSIPGTYEHLRLVLQVRSDRSGAASDSLLMRFNGDTGTNYDYQQIWGAAAAASAAETFGATSVGGMFFAAADAGAGLADAFIIDIPNYRRTTFNKVAKISEIYKGGTSSGEVRSKEIAAAWRSTAAITQVTFSPGVGPNFIAGSVATLYGWA